MRKINYISEIFLPSKSAYSIQVMKMCNELSRRNNHVELHVMNIYKKNVHIRYNCEKKFKIISHKINYNNFINRILYSLKILFYVRKSNDIFYSRSIITGILLAYINKNVIIELHHELKGFTSILFNKSKNFNFFKKIKFIFITTNLKKYFNLANRSLIAGDAVDLSSFKKVKKFKKINKTCVYTGSLAKGKGLEIILKVAKLLPEINFHIYGDFSNSHFSEFDLKKYQNIKFLGFIEYKNIPKILNKYYLYLMPYQKKVYVRSNNIEVGKFMSPMKLFEYMAADGVIIASNLKVYNHILNYKNSILIKDNSVEDWKKKIKYYFKNKFKFEYLSKNASKNVKNYTWEKRIIKLDKFLNV